MNRNVLLPFIVVIGLTGCTLAPEYTRPAAPVPADWPSGAAYQETNANAAAPTAAELPWREFITDPRLQQIIETALNNNRDLRLAALNVERARAMYGIQRAELWPSVNAAGSWYQERVPADLSSTKSAMTSERYDVNLGFSSWEIDFFGRIRSLQDRALEEYLATDQARRSVQILLVSAGVQCLSDPGRGPGKSQAGGGHPEVAASRLRSDQTASTRSDSPPNWISIERKRK